LKLVQVGEKKKKNSGKLTGEGERGRPNWEKRNWGSISESSEELGTGVLWPR